MNLLFPDDRQSPKDFLKKNWVPLLYTLMVHLVVLIVLVLARVDHLRNVAELGVELEFEEKTLEELLEEEGLEVPEEWLEQLLVERELSSNRAVNRNTDNEFKNDISTDDYVKELLDELDEARSEEDQEKLEELASILAAADYVAPEEDSTSQEQGEYRGETTISYEFKSQPLDRGRDDLTVPVYRCEGSGLVRVEVEVATNGKVLEAKVLQPVEGRDKVCLSEAAHKAALSSRFRVDVVAPSRHICVITYEFQAQ